MYTIITRNQCNFCDDAKAMMDGAGIQYMSYNVQSESSKWLLDLILKAGYKTVPQIWNSNGDHIGGYTELKQYLLEGKHG
jgi:glutaredoxin